MRRMTQAAFAGILLAGSTLWLAAPAGAQAVVIQPPVAFGYSDGYWDRGHHWHKWRDEREAREWRRANQEHYYEWKHDRDRDHGWHERDQWWGR